MYKMQSNDSLATFAKSFINLNSRNSLNLYRNIFRTSQLPSNYPRSKGGGCRGYLPKNFEYAVVVVIFRDFRSVCPFLGVPPAIQTRVRLR